MLHIFYITLYFLQSVKLEMTIQSEENPLLKYTLFPKNGPVFMRRIYTERTVAFNGTLSYPIWKYIDITMPRTSTQTSTNDLFSAYDLTKSQQNAAISLDHSERNIPPSLDVNTEFISNTNNLTSPSTDAKVNSDQAISSDSNVDITPKPEHLIPSSTSITLSPNPANSVNPSTIDLNTKSQNIVNPLLSNDSISSSLNVSIPSTVTYLPTTSHIDITEKESDITELIHPEITATSENPTKTAETNVPDILQSTTTGFIYPEITVTSPNPTATSETQDPFSDVTPIYDYTEINPQKLLRMRTENTEQTLQILTYSLEPKKPTEQNPAWLVPTNRPAYYQQNTQIVFKQEIDDAETEIEPFSTFLRKLLKVLSTKHEVYLMKLIKPFEKYVTTLVDSGKLMKLGPSTSVWIAQETQILRGPTTELQRLIFVSHISLQHRGKMLSDDANTILDDMDDVYDASEEEAMQLLLNEVKAFPNTTKPGELLARDFVYDVFILPMNRIAGTARGKTLFEKIGKIASKHNARRYEVNDENKFIDKSLELEELNSQYPKKIHEDKFIDPPLVSEVMLKRDGKNINKKRKHLHPISASKDLPDYIKIYSSKMLKEKKFKDSLNSEDNTEISSSDSDGVEILIKIRNGKYSVNKIRRNLTNAGKFNKKQVTL